MLGRALAGGGLAVALGLLPALPAAGAVSAPGDPVRDSQQWVFNMINVQPAWQVTEGSGVTVAVIDSGVDGNVSVLSGGTVISGPDYTGLHTSPQNANWGKHGTWMASIIAGHGTDGGYDGVMGIAPEAKVLSIRVIPDQGDPGYRAYNDEPEQTIQDELADGIMTAVKDHAQVISMSIGYSAPSGAVRNAITYAYQHGTVLVASSGNSGDNDTRHGNGSSAMAPVSFPPSTQAWSAWARSPSTARRPASRAATSPSRSPRQARASPLRGGTAATTPSTARARRARSWPASRR